MPPVNSRDIAVPPGRYILIMDRTKGFVQTITGPSKISMAETEVPVKWNPENSSYSECERAEDALRFYVVAGQGQYVVLTSPAIQNAEHKHPEDGKQTQAPKLDIGNTVIIPGPTSFALWWQQGAVVVDGHQLRSNQYLVAEVTNDAQARANWDKAVFKRMEKVSVQPITAPQGQSVQQDEGASLAGTKENVDAKAGDQNLGFDPRTLTTGQRIIIRGIDASFFIPPTGMRVVPDPVDLKRFVREAVTLESLQYCVLKGEDGKKKYERGPAVVFPLPTETFVEGASRERVFKAVELNQNSGIHIMVIADYKAGDKDYKAGQELFITGKDMAIYYPRAEHAIIKYDGENFVYFATAVPAGEGRYVMNKNTGEVSLVTGPKMLLLDPTKEVFVRRILPDPQVQLWYPGNTRALEINRELARTHDGTRTDQREESFVSQQRRAFSDDSSAGGGGDSIHRRSTFTPPRAITLDAKFQGAVSISVWQGYAVQVVSKDGKQRVEIGPKTVLLKYDEELTQLSLSTGKPKTTDRLFSTAYLKVAGNQVSDIIKLETSDGIEVSIKLSYQIEFINDSSKWFAVDNYVKMITDHLRSVLRGVLKKHTVAEFTARNIEIIRDAVLGKKPETGERPKMVFPQNSSRVYDVEVLSVSIDDSEINRKIADAQRAVIGENLQLDKERRTLKMTLESQEIARKILAESQKTEDAKHGNELARAKQGLELVLEKHRVEAEVELAAVKAELVLSELKKEIAAKELEVQKAGDEQKLVLNTQLQELEVKKLTAETEAVKARLLAISPEFIKAIQASNDRDALVQVAQSMGVAAYLKDHSIGAAVERLIEGSPLQGAFQKLAGSSSSPKAAEAADTKSE